MAKFFIDVLDAAGNRIGDGPIISATSWESVRRLDRAGEFRFSMPAHDKRSQFVQAKRRVICRAITPTGPVDFGGGIIDRISYKPTINGLEMEVGGDDLLRELAGRSVQFSNYSSGGNPVTHVNALATTFGFAPAGWSYVQDFFATGFYYKATGESILTVLGKIAEQGDTHFYLSGTREVTFIDAATPTSFRLVDAPQIAGETPGVCYIKSLRVLQDTYNFVSRIYPYGKQRAAGTFINLSNTNRTAPGGLTLNVGQNYMAHVANETAYGRIERVVQYKEIDELSAGATDLQSASNAVFDAAYRELLRRTLVEAFYEIELLGCGEAIRPMHSIPVNYYRVIDGVNVLGINTTLNVIESTVRIGTDGIQTTKITVGSALRWPDDDGQAAVRLEAVRQFK